MLYCTVIDEATKQKILNNIGIIIKNKATKLAPIDKGMLRSMIDYRIEGNKVIISCDVDYAADMEYGTPPGVLDENEKDDLAEWANRHGLPAGPVIRKIEREGIKVGTPKNPIKTPNGTFRPFLRPAVYQSIPDIKEMIKSI